MEDYEIVILSLENWDLCMNPFHVTYTKTENICRQANLHVEESKIFFDQIKDLLCAGLSLFAKTKNGDVVGWRLTVDWYDFQQKLPILSFPQSLEILFYTMHIVEADHLPVPKKSGEWCRFYALCTREDHARKGLATALTRRNLEIQKQRGYEGCIVVSTSQYTSRIYPKLGFKQRNLLHIYSSN